MILEKLPTHIDEVNWLGTTADWALQSAESTVELLSKWSGTPNFVEYKGASRDMLLFLRHDTDARKWIISSRGPILSLYTRIL